VHQYLAGAYGVAIGPKRQSECHIRPVEAVLDRVLALDARPLAVARPARRRLAGGSSPFTALLVAMVPATGGAARARVGIGSYFNAPWFEDHWLCEYWNAAQERWVRVDTQLDEVWRANPAIDFEELDVPHDRFLIASDAWLQCRTGQADAARFGIFRGELRG